MRVLVASLVWLHGVLGLVLHSGGLGGHLRPTSTLSMKSGRGDVEVEFKVVSMNILAPCYRKISEPTNEIEGEDRVFFEKEEPERYLTRNGQIIDQLVASNADVICVQEFWNNNEELQNLYVEKLCDDMDYTMKTLPRTSHWRKRDDGLAVFVKEERVFIQDYRDILFHDCGDRVAQMLLLAIRPEVDWDFDDDEDGFDGFDDEEGEEEDDDMPLQQFICVNTHLLFPHNEYSSKIRMREATKILGFVESYRQRELCRSICSRSSVRVPIIVTGDFNGSPNGKVYSLMRSQNYGSVFSSDEYSSLVTHLSHRNEAINVDHIFYLNPSDQTEDRLDPIPVPDWTNLVFRELKEKIIAQYGIGNFYEAFRSFDRDDTNYISKEEFSLAINQLGFQREGQPALTADEIEVLVDSADKNGNGQIDFKEFCTRFWMADNDLNYEDVDYSGEVSSRSAEETEREGEAGTAVQLQEASKSTWLTQDGGQVSQGGHESGISDAAGDSKWGSTAPADAATGVESEGRVAMMTEGQSTVSTVSRKTQIILFEGDDAPGIWGEYSTELVSAQSRIQSLPDSRPLGDMRVKHMAVTPQALSTGEWPEDYLLSDHGMVEATFVGKCLAKEKDEEN